MNEVDKIVAAILAAAYSFKHPGAINHIHFVRAYQNMLEEIQRPDSGEIKASSAAVEANGAAVGASEVMIKASELASRLEEIIRENPWPRSTESH